MTLNSKFQYFLLNQVVFISRKQLSPLKLKLNEDFPASSLIRFEKELISVNNELQPNRYILNSILRYWLQEGCHVSCFQIASTSPFIEVFLIENYKQFFYLCAVGSIQAYTNCQKVQTDINGEQTEDNYYNSK